MTKLINRSHLTISEIKTKCNYTQFLKAMIKYCSRNYQRNNTYLDKQNTVSNLHLILILRYKIVHLLHLIWCCWLPDTDRILHTVIGQIASMSRKQRLKVWLVKYYNFTLQNTYYTVLADAVQQSLLFIDRSYTSINTGVRPIYK